MVERGWFKGRVAMTLALGLTANAGASPLSASPITALIRKGDCRAAVTSVIQGAASSERDAIYVGGRMLDDGICVRQDYAAATKFFARASDLGDHGSSLEYAAKIGLGEGVEQNYQRAGDLCRAAGVDPDKQLSDYALGYACTLRGLAGRLLRQRLPAGAFRPDSGALLVEFKPASAEMSIRSTPKVEVEVAEQTGSRVRHARINARDVIEAAWQEALGRAPRPDPARLQNQVAQLTLDVDMSLDTRPVKDKLNPDLARPLLGSEGVPTLMLPMVR
jgi:hypothetical protein